MGLSNYLPSSRLIQPGVCTSSTRPASPFEGQCIFETDTDRLLVWNGTAWVIPNAPSQNPTGLEYIAQSAVNAQTTITLDNCFTTTYAHYFITYNLTTSIQGQYTALRLRAGGTPKAVNYDRAGFYTTTGGASGADGYGTGQTEMFLAGQSTTMLVGSAYIYNPQVSGRTGFTGTASYPGLYQMNGSQTETYSADGFQIFASGTAATYTGTVRVYGLRNS